MSKFLTPPVWYDKNGNLNEMLTGEASGGGVAVGNSAAAAMYGVAVGYSSSGQSAGVAVGSDANASSGGIAVGYSSSADNAGVAIGSNADASSGGIAIGQDAHAASSNTIQLGDSALTFDLNVGDGTGALRIGNIKFKKMNIVGHNVSIPQSGVYLCCTIHKESPQALVSMTNVSICFIDDLSDTRQSVSMLTSESGSCFYDATDQKIKPGTNFRIQYCFQIISF